MLVQRLLFTRKRTKRQRAAHYGIVAARVAGICLGLFWLLGPEKAFGLVDQFMASYNAAATLANQHDEALLRQNAASSPTQSSGESSASVPAAAADLACRSKQASCPL